MVHSPFYYKQQNVNGDPEEPGTMSIDEEL